MARQQKKLGELLVEWGIISPKEITKALEHGKKQGLRIGEALIDLKLCSENNVYKALAAQHNMDYVDLEKNSIPPKAVGLIPDDLMRKYLIVPLGMENGRLRIAVHDPLDLEMLDILRFRLHKEIRTVAGPAGPHQAAPRRACSTPPPPTPSTRRCDETIDRLRKSLDSLDGPHGR